MNNDYNKVTVYLLPALIEQTDIYLKDLEKYGFVDSFIGDTRDGSIEKISTIATNTPMLYLLFKPTSQVLLQELIEKCEEYLSDEYDYPNGYTVLVFYFPERHLHNFKMFLQGRYSKFTQAYQNIFPQQPSLEERSFGAKKPVTMMVFKKAPERKRALEDILGVPLERDAELCSIFGWREVLDISKYINDDKQEDTEHSSGEVRTA